MRDGTHLIFLLSFMKNDCSPELKQIIPFPLLVYDVSGAASDRNCVVLNDIHIDIMDYIVPASCTDTGMHIQVYHA